MGSAQRAAVWLVRLLVGFLGQNAAGVRLKMSGISGCDTEEHLLGRGRGPAIAKCIALSQKISDGRRGYLLFAV